MIPGSFLSDLAKDRGRSDQVGSLETFLKLEYESVDRDWVRAEIRKEAPRLFFRRLRRWLTGAPLAQRASARPHQKARDRVLPRYRRRGRGRRVELSLPSGLGEEGQEAERSPPKDPHQSPEGQVTQGEFDLGGGESLRTPQEFLSGEDTGAVLAQGVQDAAMERGGRAVSKGCPAQIHDADSAVP